MTQRDESNIGDDAREMLDWLRAQVAKQGTGRRPSRIEMGLGWYDDGAPPTRVGRAIKELLDADLVYLWDDVHIPGMGPWVCPR